MPIDYIPYLRKKIGHDRCLTVGVTTLVVDEQDRILLEKRSDNGLYCLPGGSLDLDETVSEGAKREVLEETGIILDNLSLFMIRSGNKTQLHYPNGDVTDYVDLHFLSRVDSTKVKLKIQDGESTSLSFYRKEDMPEEKMMLRGTLAAIEKYYRGDREVTFD